MALLALAGVIISVTLVVWTVSNRALTPSCSWPLRIHGEVSAEQSGLVRCYLRALAHRDSAGLVAVAVDDPPVHITKADLHYSPDARSGEATATFTATNDTGYFLVTIIFRNGVTERTGIMDMWNEVGSSRWDGWRMDIGTPYARWARRT